MADVHPAWVIAGTIAGIVGAVAAVVAVLPDDSSKVTTQTTIASPPSVGATIDAPRPPSATSLPPGGSGNDYSSGSTGGGGVNSGDQISTIPAPAQPAIVRVDVSSRRGNGAITDLGPGRFRLPNYVRVIPPPQMTFDWSSQGPSGEISGSCRVDIRIDGPTGAEGFPKSQQDGDCSGSADQRIAVYDSGDYTVYVTVTPPDGGAPVSGQTTFTLVN